MTVRQYVSFLPFLVTRVVLAVDGGGGAAIFNSLCRYSIAQEQFFDSYKTLKMSRYCLPLTISPALFPDKFATRKVEDVPDAQIDGFGPSEARKWDCSPLRNISNSTVAKS
jgi:hypothetical protein